MDTKQTVIGLSFMFTGRVLAAWLRPVAACPEPARLFSAATGTLQSQLQYVPEPYPLAVNHKE